MLSKIPDSVYKHIFANYMCENFAYLRSEDKHFLFFEPVIRIWAENEKSFVKTVQNLEEFKDIWGAFNSKASKIKNSGRNPFCAGYLSYELGHTIENLMNLGTSTKGPLYDFCIYNKTLEINNTEQRWHSHDFDLEPFWTYSQPTVDYPKRALRSSDPSLHEIEENIVKYSNFTREKYEEAVSKIVKRIRQGDVYQVNLSQKFSLPYQGNPFDFFYALSEKSPASFAAFFNAAGKYFISSSPERFLRYDGNRLHTSPIKGTKLRTRDDDTDMASLSNSAKDLSELTMIVDIERNDLSKVAAANSVQVERHARVDSISQLHHLVSDISCKLKEGTSLSEVIKATFPSGSITGAPKISAMKIIAEIENINRGVYTGSIGWLAGDGTYEFNIAIRTAVIENGRISFGAGGGVVFDSKPQDEFYETLAKAKGFYLAYSSLFSDN